MRLRCRGPEPGQPASRQALRPVPGRATSTAASKGKPISAVPGLLAEVRPTAPSACSTANTTSGALAGQNVEVVWSGGLEVEVFFDSVLVATPRPRGSGPGFDEALHRQALAAPASRPRTEAIVIRKVDKNGAVRFAGTTYFVGQAYRRRQVQVALVKDTVQIWDDDRLLRTHPIRHDRRKEHGAFANPSGRPDRINAA